MNCPSSSRLERGLGDAISCIVNEAAETFIVHTKELINVLAVQDLSGERIRRFVKKVFKR